jgi:hypothetical protein
MDRDLNRHIADLSDAADSWLQPDNRALKEAIDRTADEKLFAFHDIKHQVRHLKRSLTRKALEEWAVRAELERYYPVEKRILCLHAGNLPLVGLQDALAVILSGGHYMGKLSRKDPYLLASLLDELAGRGLIEEGSYATDLVHFSDKKADGVLFAGSPQTVPDVEKALEGVGISDGGEPRLMRTAHYSVAYIEDSDPETMRDLTEAVFRYGGNGCRSVAYVVAPFSLHSQKCHFTDYVEEFWLHNPQHARPGPILYHHYAANKALNIEQAWLDHFLIEERFTPHPSPYTLYWITGGERELADLIAGLPAGLQTVYTQSGEPPQALAERYPDIGCEKLSKAQQPPVWWKPDGVDTIAWLCKNMHEDLNRV